MKAKLVSIINSLKSLGAGLVSKAPLPIGIAIGFLCHGPISLAIAIVRTSLRLL